MNDFRATQYLWSVNSQTGEFTPNKIEIWIKKITQILKAAVASP